MQYIVPQQRLSRLVGWFANTRIGLIKRILIRGFIKRYRVDMSIAANPDPDSYPTFNAFFTRALGAEKRPISDAPHDIVCPADGAISEIGEIDRGRLLQAKGRYFTVTDLLGGDAAPAKSFDNGLFATIYLSPKDYHRVHMPCGGTLTTMIHIPGTLFSVNGDTAATVTRLFARNERVIALFDTDIGPMAVIMVGAMIVAGIETVWSGQVTPAGRRIQTIHYGHSQLPVTLKRGAEMGRFMLGSTVIVLLPPNCAAWEPSLRAQSPVVMGQRLGCIG